MADGVKISGDISKSIDWLQQNAQRYFDAALYEGARVIKENAKEELLRQIPKAAIRNPKYDDTLLDAIRHTTANGDEITVHTMGTRDSGSGTYRARFFEQSKERWQKKYKGVPLKTKRYLGQLPQTRFFSTAVNMSEEESINAMKKVVDHLFENAEKH